MKISISQIWNESIIGSDREQTSRDYLWASQLMKPTVDLWLHLRGTQHSNAPNERSRRKFQSGNFFEHMVSMMLIRSGVMTEKQEEIWTEYDIRVKGKGDFVLSGKFDFDKAIQDIKSMLLPSDMERMYLQMSEAMRNKYEGVEFNPCAIEVKSVAERTMTKIEKQNKPLESHIMQTCHYKIGRGLGDGVVLVLCRDDLRMFEYFVTEDDEKRYVERVNYLAGVLKSDTQPAIENEIIFDNVMGKFSKNLGIEYSSFLTMLYGYEKPMDYSDAVKGKVARWNRLLARLKQIESGVLTKTGKATVLTDKNKMAVDEMSQNGFNAYELVKVADITEEEEE